MDPFKNYSTSAFQFKGELVRLPSAQHVRIDPNLRRDLRDFLLDQGYKQAGNCSKCTAGEKFTVPAGNYNHPVLAHQMPVCTACDRVDLWPEFQKAA